jgi:hypothetical protein
MCCVGKIYQKGVSMTNRRKERNFQMRNGVVLVLTFVLFGCPKRSDVPESAYDPSILKAADEIAADQKAKDDALSSRTEVEKTSKPECSRESGGCEDGYVCNDSYFCKDGFDGQCSGSGDKRCHKLCKKDDECPEKMPVCGEIPVFQGSEQGTLFKACIKKPKS